MKTKKVESVKIVKDEPTFFVSYIVQGKGEMRELFSPYKWVRLLNLNHQQVCEELEYISRYRDVKNDDGTQVIGEELTILPSETMDMEMDVNSKYVSIKDNYLTHDGIKMKLYKWLYGGDHYIQTCWESSKKFEFRKMMEESRKGLNSTTD